MATPQRNTLQCGDHHDERQRRQDAAKVPQGTRGRTLSAQPGGERPEQLGLRTALATELETIGRKTGQIRRVPVSAQFDDNGAWLISQHGTRSGWGRNIVDNPNVRVRQGSQWRNGIAELRPDDDVVARGRKFGRFGSKVVKALETTPVSVRIDFAD
jgi:deazaflavin-dependent oxidoreductase (nitroreductase family)